MNEQMDELLEKLKVVLPNLTADICDQVKLTFEEHGVESWSDISLLSSQHLVPPLKTVQCIKLLRAVTTETGLSMSFMCAVISNCLLSANVCIIIIIINNNN